MAMMISKFHKLIQSRLLWGVFLIVIVFSFVIWGMVWPSQIDEAERLNAAGMLDGVPVTHGEFSAAYRSTYMARALALGRDADSSPEAEELLRRLSWQRLATLREAAQLGISVPEEELVSVIRANFSDKEKGYNPEQYQAFLQNVLRPMGFSPAQFEQHIREEILMQKLGSLVGRQAFVTPLEIQRTFDTLLDSFQVDYVEISAAEAEKSVSIDDAAARRLFDADPAAFTLPAMREVSYAAFPIAAYVDTEAEIPEDDIQDYYELHIQDYTRAEEAEDGKPRETVADLDDVRESIVAALRREAAVALADAEAAELAFRAIPDRDGRIPDFAEEVQKAGKSVQKTSPFARFEVPVEDAGDAFADAAFALEMNAFDRVSAPFAGEDNLYVLYLEQLHEPRVPEFEEVRDRVRETARRQAVREALQSRALAVQKAARAGIAEGKDFAAALQGQNLPVQSAEPFTGISGSSSTNPAIQALVQVVVAYNPGEVTDPVPSDNGLIVAYVASRTPAEPATYDAYRDEIASTIRNRRAQGLFQEWQAALLSPARFTDLQRTPGEHPESGEDGGEDAPGADESSEPM